MKVRIAQLTAVATLLITTTSAHALQLSPGLWEFTSNDMQVDGQQMPAIDEMVEQLKGMPAEQRAMMQEMLSRQGVELGANGIRMCLSEAQVKSRKLPFQDEPGCTQEIIEQDENAWSFRFDCPDAKGRGETRLISDREVVSIIESEYAAGNRQGNSRMESRGKWLGSDCGSLQSVE